MVERAHGVREVVSSSLATPTMKFIKNTTWDEVFDGWEKREANNPGWVNCATKIKGWPDWKSWRKFTASQIKADKREWKIYEFTNPSEEIPKMLIGPYSGWQSRLPKKNTASFEDLLSIPKQLEEFSKHDGVLSIMEGLPFTTELIGIIRDDIDKIVCLEGHHRAVAITLSKIQGKNIDWSDTKIDIALTHLKKDEIQLLDEMLERGTTKEKSRDMT